MKNGGYPISYYQVISDPFCLALVPLEDDFDFVPKPPDMVGSANVQAIIANRFSFSATWVCLKIGCIPNEIAIFHRDNDP